MGRLGRLTVIRPGVRWAPAALAACIACTSTVRQVGGDRDGGAGTGASDASNGGSSGDGGGTGAASGAGGSAGDAGGGSIDCAEFARVQCELMSTCSTFLLQIAHGDLSTCRERTELECTLAMSAPDARPASLAACADALAGASCEAFMSGLLATQCTFSGTRPTGAPCVFGSQCASGICSEPVGTDACGECVARAPAGGNCTESVCAAGLSCSNGVCVLQPAQGESCALSLSCAFPYACVNDVCGDPLPVGAPCDQAPAGCDQSQGQLCLPDPNGAMTCRVSQVAGLNESCGLTGSEFRFCSGGLTCSQATFVCVEKAGEGSPCDVASNSLCVSPARCVNGRCALPDPDGCAATP